MLLTTVRQAVTIPGPGAIKTLVFDKGCWDGATMWKLKNNYGIDFAVPAKANLNAAKRLKSQEREEYFDKIRKGLPIKFEKSVEDAPNYEGKLRAIVVKDPKAKKKRKGKQPVHVYPASLLRDSSVAIYFEHACVIVYREDCFGIFDVREYTDIICSAELEPP